MPQEDSSRERSEMPEPPGQLRAAPYVFVCVSGRKYAYCMCQMSSRFPQCDGSHCSLTDEQRDSLLAEGRGTKPEKMTFDEARTVAWCACGRSRNKPFCDGSHTTPLA